MRWAFSLASLLLLVAATSARAATINVGPADSYAKIEAAQPGDEVVVAPGTYKFRVYLTQQATPGKPILIHAADPMNPPVWDLSSTLVESAPGSYTASDRGRGCWQFSGATNIHVSGLVITGCHTAGANSAGVRYYNGSSGIVLSDIVFRDNDNGLTGGSQDSEITVEFCEFDANGTLLASSSSPSHNIYIYGGTFTLRYSYAHDPIQGQNFHIRAQTATLEYNWFARAKSYQGDLMTDDDDDGSGRFTQQMLLRGNVIFQGTTQSNASQIIAVYNDAGVSGLTLNVTLVYNTFVGPTGASNGHAALVHLSNADGTTMSAELDDNLIVGAGAATSIEDTTAGKVSGTHNWVSATTSATGLTGTIAEADPMFKDAANEDFTPGPGSAAIGAASESIGNSLLPTAEYYRNETVARLYRPRASAHDIGAFESTTSGAAMGPYGPAGAPASGQAGTSGTRGGSPGTAGGRAGGPGGAAGRPGAGGIGGARTTGTGGFHNGGAWGTGGHLSGGAGAPGGAAGMPAGPGVGGAAGGGGGGGGCSCAIAGSPTGSGLVLGLLGALALARRRRTAARH